RLPGPDAFFVRPQEVRAEKQKEQRSAVESAPYSSIDPLWASVLHVPTAGRKDGPCLAGRHLMEANHRCQAPWPVSGQKVVCKQAHGVSRGMPQVGAGLTRHFRWLRW